MIPTYAIAAVSLNGVIGNNGQIPWRCKEDFQWFKHRTMDDVLLMGRKTFASIGKPLPRRETLVLTSSDKDFGVTKIANIVSFDYTPYQDRPTWICGGGEIYRQFLPFCQYLYLTTIKQTVEGDTYFPENYRYYFTFDHLIHETEDYKIERLKSNIVDYNFPNFLLKDNWSPKIGVNNSRETKFNEKM